MSKQKSKELLAQLPPQSTVAIEKLQEAFTDEKGKIDLDLMLFYVSWIKNGMNGGKAYKEIHPDVTDHSARVLGSRELSKVNRELVMSAYGLDADMYFNQLKEGLQANKQIAAVVINKKGSPTSQANGETPANSMTKDFVEVPDHYARKPYHDKLGKLLGIESDKGTSIAVQVNNITPDKLSDDQLDAYVS